jgi:hypothetical protein
MKKLIFSLVILGMTVPGFSNQLQNYKKDTDALWRTGSGAEDGTYTAISTSMFGWGIALAVGIAILASVIHQSAAGHSTTSTTSSN